MGRKTYPAQQYIEERIERVPFSGCWVWMGSLVYGYGQASRGDKSIRAHRLSYETYKGPVPKGMCVCHTCDNPCCVNPDHLFLGTHKDNAEDKVKKGRQQRGLDLSSITPEAVQAILQAPGTQREIAASFGLVHSTVGLIKRGTHWSQRSAA